MKLYGNEVAIRNPLVAMELGISVIHQEMSLVPYLTVVDNITLGSECVRGRSGLLDTRLNVERAQKALGLVGSDIDPLALIADLSIAERQMVAIARAVSRDSRIVVMDEPTSSLTENEAAILFEVIRSLTRNGVGVIYISHRLEEVLSVSDRITVLRDGLKVGTVASSSVSKDDLVTMMVNRTLTEDHGRRTGETGGCVLEVKNLSSASGVRDVSFRVMAGEVVGVAGLVGSGRTELARCIFGVDPVTEGTILVNGQEIRIRNPVDAMSIGIGYVPEDRRSAGLVLKMNVLENMSLGRLNSRCSDGNALLMCSQFIRSRAEHELVKHYIDQLSIKTPSVWQGVDKLSGGNQQKVVLSRWLALAPNVLILDEPTRGIDVGAKQEIYALINTCTERGMGILLISSELPEIVGMSDRVLVMSEGTLRGELRPPRITAEEVMRLAIPDEPRSQSLASTYE